MNTIELIPKWVFVAFAVLILGVVYLFVMKNNESTEEFTVQSAEASMIPKAESKEFFVHVCGAVKKPGVYRFSQKPRIFDAIRKAGGLTGKADSTALNMAESVEDGTQIVVPKKTERHVTEKNTSDESDGRICLNEATQEELMTLSGIGEAKARAIVEYRNDHGKFNSIEEIKQVNGIKDAVYNQIKNQIKI